MALFQNIIISYHLNRLASNNERKAAQSVQALARIGTPVVQVLGTVLHSGGTLPGIRAAAVLGEIANPIAMQTLIYELTHPTPEVRQSVADALVKVGNRAVITLLKTLENDSSRRPQVVEILGRIGQPAVEALTGMLEKINFEFFTSVIDALVSTRLPQATLALLSRFGKEYELYRLKVLVEGLDRLGWQPGMNEEAVYYWLGKGQQEHIISLGVIAITPILRMYREKAVKQLTSLDPPPVEALVERVRRSSEKNERNMLTQTLSALYCSARLSEAQRLAILRLRDENPYRHTDTHDNQHTDYVVQGCGMHIDDYFQSHTDNSTGLDIRL
jgi:hypothetical protein